MNSNKTILLTSTAIIVALALVLAPSMVADNVFAGSKSNKAFQGIFQGQNAKQNSFVISGDDTKNSGNNFNFQFQKNKGSNSLGQWND
ncbi:MAG: hypothetical protein AB7V56_16670 [Candidatus Nitrosocosmicus sp.]